VRRVHSHPLAAHIDIHANGVGERYQVLAPIAPIHYQEVSATRSEQAADNSEYGAGNINYLRPDDLMLVEFTLFEGQAVGLRDYQQSPYKRFGSGHRIVSNKLHDHSILMKPEPLEFKFQPGSSRENDGYVPEQSKPVREI